MTPPRHSFALRLWPVLGAVLIAAALPACGTGDLTFPGDVPATATVGTPGAATPTPGGVDTPTVPPVPTFTPTPLGTGNCLASGDGCTDATNCCSDRCVSQDGVVFVCE